MEKVANLSAKPFLVEKSQWRKFDETFRRWKRTRSLEGLQPSLRSHTGAIYAQMSWL